MINISKAVVQRGAGAAAITTGANGIGWKFFSISSSSRIGIQTQSLGASSGSSTRRPAFPYHQQTMASYGGSKKDEFVPVHYDELPVPGGSWADHFKKKNQRYNKQLGFGLAAIFFTLFFIYRSEKIFFNASPPPLPGEDDECNPEPEEC